MAGIVVGVIEITPLYFTLKAALETIEKLYLRLATIWSLE